MFEAFGGSGAFSAMLGVVYVCPATTCINGLFVIGLRLTGSIALSTKLNIGIAGAGVFGGHHASKYAAHDKAALISLFDIDQDRADALAQRFGVAAYRDYSKFLLDLDAVIIAAPAGCHFELAHEALEAGRHVFVEKPLALCTDDADKLIELANAKRCVLQVGHQERYVFDAAGLFAREQAPKKIHSVRRGSATGRCEDVSVIFDLMIHDLDLVRHVTNAEVLNVAAFGGANEASADLILSNGTIVSLSASRQAASVERRMTLEYDDGVIEFDFVNRVISNSTLALLPARFDDAAGSRAFSDPLGYGADQFIAAVLSGNDPIVTGLHGRIAVDWAQRIEKALLNSLDIEHDPRERLLA